MVADSLVERDFVTSLDPEIELQLESIESAERAAVKNLFVDPSSVSPASGGTKSARDIFRPPLRGSGASETPDMREVVDEETGEVISKKPTDARGRTLQANTKSDRITTEKKTSTSGSEESNQTTPAGSGHQKEIPITRAPVTVSRETERSDAEDAWSQYSQDTRDDIRREERNYVPEQGHEPEM